MTTQFDRAWLEDIQRRLESDATWQSEVADFLVSVRDLGRKVIARTSRSAVELGHEEDILSLAARSFVASGIRAYRGDASPASYYASIVARWTVSYMRPKYRTERPLDPRDIELGAGVVTPEATQVDLRHDLAAALRALYDTNPSYAEAFFLYEMLEFGSDVECAEKLGISEEAFRKRRDRGRVFLHRFLAGDSR